MCLYILNHGINFQIDHDPDNDENGNWIKVERKKRNKTSFPRNDSQEQLSLSESESPSTINDKVAKQPKNVSFIMPIIICFAR